MPNGYDSRGGGQSTFAFNAAAPVQSQSELSGQSAGARVVGGDSQSGFVTGQPITVAPSIADSDIPQFLSKAMEPYLQRKQAENVARGFTDAMAGKSMAEIHKSNSGILQVFGPSHYEEGGALYTASTAVKKAFTQTPEELDRTMRLTPDQLSKDLAGRMQSMTTGDPLVDSHISREALQAAGPYIDTITKARAVFLQKQAVLAQAKNGNASGDLNQQVYASTTATSAPTDEQSFAVKTGDQNYLNSLAPIAGQDEVSRNNFLLGHVKRELEAGHGHNYHLVEGSGILAGLTDEQRVSLDKAADTAAHMTVGNAGLDPEVQRMHNTIEERGARSSQPGGYMTGAEVEKDMNAVNAYVARKTGFTEVPYFTPAQIAEHVKGVADKRVSAGLRLETERFELKKQQLEFAHVDQVEERKRVEAAKVTRQYVFAGDPSIGVATGDIKQDDVNTVMQEAYSTKNWATVGRTFERNARNLNESVAGQMQSGIASSIGHGPTNAFLNSVSEFNALRKVSPDAAYAYAEAGSGKYGAAIEGYNKAIAAHDTPLLAWQQNFGDTAKFQKFELPYGVKMDDAMDIVSKAVTKSDGHWYSQGRTPLNPSSATRYGSFLLPKAADLAQRTGMPLATAVGMVDRSARGNGEVDQVGPFMAIQPKGSIPMARVVKATDTETDRAVMSIADRKLSAVKGGPQADDDNHLLIRLEDEPNGKAKFYLHAISDDGTDHTGIFITSDEIRAELHKGARNQLQAGQRQTPVNLHLPSAGDITP